MSSRKFRIPLAALLELAFLVGCGVSTVTIEGSFPTPNISKLPLNVAVYYDQSLRDFAYMEYSETGAEEFNTSTVPTRQSKLTTTKTRLRLLKESIKDSFMLPKTRGSAKERSAPVMQ